MWHNTTSPPQTDGSVVLPRCANVPSHEDTVAQPGRYNWSCAFFPRLHIPNHESIGLVIFAQLMPECWGTFPGMSFPLIIALLHGRSGPHLIHASLGPPESITQTESGSVKPFLHRSRHSVVILQNGSPVSRLKLPLPMGIWAHLTRDSLDPSKPTTQKVSRLVQPFLHR